MEHQDGYLELPEVSLARCGFIAGVLGYTMALYLSYVHIISPSFDYLRLTYQPESGFTILVAEVFALMPAAWMPVRIKRPSQIVYVFLYLMVMIPTLLVGTFTGTFPMSRVILFGTLLIFVFGVLQLIYRVPLLDIPKIVKTNTGFWLIFLAMTVGLYGILIVKYGIPTRIPLLTEVYAQRSEFRRTIGGIGAYTFFWLAKAINPFLIAKGYLKRSPVLVGVGVGGQLMLFAMSGMKSILFSFLLLAAVLIALWRRGRYTGNWIVWGFIILIGGAALIDSYFVGSLTTELFVRRLLLVPGLNTSLYFDFFSTNPHVLLGHSVLGWLVNYPYGDLPAMIIGDAYFGHIDTGLDMRANANLWADAYANFGILGIFFFTAVLAGLFWFADSFTKGCSLKLSVLMLAYPAYVLVNTKLQTTLLTHGLGLVLLILYLLPRHEAPSDRE